MPIPRAGQLDRLRELASQTLQSNQQNASSVRGAGSFERTLRTTRPAYARGAEAYAATAPATPAAAAASPDEVTISAEARQLADNVLRLVRAQPSPAPSPSPATTTAAVRPNSHQKHQAEHVYGQTAQSADLSQPHVLITMAEPPQPSQASQGASWLA